MADLEAIGREQLNIFRAWHALDPEAEIIDSDVAPRFPNPLEFEDVGQVRDVLGEHADSIPKDAPPLLEAKPRASLAFLEASDGFISSLELDYPAYIEKTMGARPEMFPESLLEAQAERLADAARELGVRWDPGDRAALKQKVELHEDRDAFTARIIKTARWSGPIILAYAGSVPELVEPTLTDSEDAPRAWQHTDENGKPLLEISTDPALSWTAARVADTMLHEPAHGVQMSIWGNAIREGRLNPAFGLITQHSLELVQMETVSHTTSALGLGESDNPEYIFQGLNVPYTQEVMSNGRLMLHGGENADKVNKYLEERMPLDLVEGRPVEDLEYEVEDIGQLTYWGAYGPAIRLGLRVLGMAREKQINVMQTLYGSALTPKEVEAEIAKVENLAA